MMSSQEMSCTKLLLRSMPASGSKVEEWESLLKLQETTWSSVLPKMPFSGPFEACFTPFLMSLYWVAFSKQHVRFTMDRHIGDRNTKNHANEHPNQLWDDLAQSHGSSSDAGMMFWAAPWPSHYRFPERPSTVFWVAVMAWIVVMNSSTMSKLSWMTLAGGGGGDTKPLVFQKALLAIMSCHASCGSPL